MENELKNQTLKSLRILGKTRSIKYIYKLKKHELINEIIKRKNENEILSTEEKNINEIKKQNMKSLRILGKKYTIENIYKLKKGQLLTQILMSKKERDNQLYLKTFPFDDEIIVKPKIKREKKIKCDICDKYIIKTRIESHKLQHNEENDFILIETAFQNRLLTYQHNNQENKLDIESYMDSIKEKTINILKNSLEKFKNIKINLEMECQFKKGEDKHNEEMEYSLQLKNEILRNVDELEIYWNDQKEKFISKCDEFQAQGSGWTLKNINHLRININKYKPLSGSSYIDLPSWIKEKQACINIKNYDNECFRWSIISCLHPVKDHVERLSKYKKFKDELNFKGIEFPVKIQDIPKFENQNKINITIFSFEDKMIYPLYHNKKQIYDKKIDLLYFGDKTNNHYCWIKNLSRLLNNQLETGRQKKYICRRCLNYSTRTEELLKKHEQLCFKNDPCVPKMPEDTILKFKNIQKMLRHPYAIYCDFESILKPIQTCQPNPEKSYTLKTELHVPCSYGLYVKSIYDNIENPLEIYKGEDADKHFINRVTEHVKNIYKFIKKNNPITDIDLEEFEKSQECYLCKEEFDWEDNPKVKDHDHYTGKYRGAACNSCNLKYKQPLFVPVLFHNLSCYDCHLFVKNLGEDKSSLKLLPNNEEKYISFSKVLKMDDGKSIDIRFIDSFRFLNSSLDKLSSNLDPDQLRETMKYFPQNDLDILFRKQGSKIIRKGIYPYEYMDSFDKFMETKLPSIDKFYSSLTKENISLDEYNHAQKVWKYFKIRNLQEWHDLYLKLDVLLLSDVFENFRDICLDKSYDLDPVWYYTTPGFAWDCMLKYTKVELELLSDYEMYLFFEKGIRGGISQCSNRYGKSDDNTQLMYIDANNLYGWALSQKLPQKDFKWMTEEELESNLDNILNSDNETGYVLEVDLSFPKDLELHNKFNDLPLAPENIIPPGGKVGKLLCHFDDKKNYIIHYKILKLYKELGIKITKIHRGIKFTQSDFMNSYIRFNTDRRQQSKNEFEKDFWKLMSNAVFGKSMQSVRKQQNIKLYTYENKVQKVINKPTFKSRTIFGENLTAIHSYKTKILFDKPIYIGQAVLDLSKLLMYDFHYNVIKNEFEEKVKLLYMDTDSLTYEFKNVDFYEFMKNNLNYFDTSDYPRDHPLYSDKNKKVIGKFKDELNGKQMLEFVGIRSKMYSFITHEKEEKKLKGIKKAVLNKEIKFEDYKNCLMNHVEYLHKQKTIRSHGHEIFTEELNKKSLSWKDDKRHLIENSTDTYAHGHININYHTKI